MKLTTYLCLGILIVYGAGAAVYALSGFDLLLFVTAGNLYLYRALLSLAGVAAAWLLFWVLAFKPLKFLS